MTPKVLSVDMVKFAEWIKKGAQPTETVAALVTRFQSGTPFPTKVARPSKKAKAKAEKAVADAAEAKSAAEAEKAAASAPAPEAPEVVETPEAETTEAA